MAKLFALMIKSRLEQMINESKMIEDYQIGFKRSQEQQTTSFY